MVQFEEFTKDLGVAVKNLHEKGALLTVKSGDEMNTMTIGWGNLGFQWGKCIFTILVRKQRYTYSIIEKADTFTVTIPLNNELKDIIKFCGTKSGSIYDKFKVCDLDVIQGQVIDTPVINKENTLTYECKIVYKQEMKPEFLSQEIKANSYSAEDYHVMYVGEVEAVYRL